MSEENPQRSYRGRLAPTPSGFLHKGHVQTFRTAWNRANEQNGTVIFRMDDLDSCTMYKEYANACMEDMRGMGLDWDEGPDVGGEYGPYEQSKRGKFYFETLRRLFDLNLIYPCVKSRKEIKAFGLFDSVGSEYLFPRPFDQVRY